MHCKEVSVRRSPSHAAPFVATIGGKQHRKRLLLKNLFLAESPLSASASDQDHEQNADSCDNLDTKTAFQSYLNDDLVEKSFFFLRFFAAPNLACLFFESNRIGI